MGFRRSYAIPATIFDPLVQGFEAGRPDPADDPAPADPAVVQRISEALTSAIAGKPPGLPYVVELDQVELAVDGRDPIFPPPAQWMRSAPISHSADRPSAAANHQGHRPRAQR